ncbi:MAG: peptide deformylase [Planctomycetes bacterium]|nr:peptide deformylase [Planctomycetota bacterium]
MDILVYPEPSLRDEARPIERVDDRVREVARAMLEAMYAARGVGLAGPQVGFPYRLITLNLTGQPEDAHTYLNPELREADGDEVVDEGCLSFPGLSVPLHRSTRVLVGVEDLEGQRFDVAADGLLARAFQHEIDHLDGILIVNRLTPAERARCSGYLKEAERRAGKARKAAGARGR